MVTALIRTHKESVITDATNDTWACNGKDCRGTAYISFPWLTTVGPGGVVMMLVAWVARSEPEEHDESEARLPAYSALASGP